MTRYQLHIYIKTQTIMKQLISLLSVMTLATLVAVLASRNSNDDLFEANLEALAAVENNTGAQKGCYNNVTPGIIPGIVLMVRDCDSCEEVYCTHADTQGRC